MKYPSHYIETTNDDLKLIPVQSWIGIVMPLIATILVPITLATFVMMVMKGSDQLTDNTPIYAALALLLIMASYFIIGGGISDILIAVKAITITLSEDTFFVNGIPHPRRQPMSVEISSGRSNGKGSTITYRLYICYNKGKFPWAAKKAFVVGHTKESLLPHAKVLAHFMNVDFAEDSIY